MEALVASGRRASITEMGVAEDDVPTIPVKPVNVTKAIDVLRQVHTRLRWLQLLLPLHVPDACCCGARV